MSVVQENFTGFISSGSEPVICGSPNISCCFSVMVCNKMVRNVLCSVLVNHYYINFFLEKSSASPKSSAFAVSTYTNTHFETFLTKMTRVKLHDFSACKLSSLQNIQWQQHLNFHSILIENLWLHLYIIPALLTNYIEFFHILCVGLLDLHVV